METTALMSGSNYELEPSIATQLTLGAVFTTHLAAATLALHEVLLRHGTTVAESHRLPGMDKL